MAREKERRKSIFGRDEAEVDEELSLKDKKDPKSEKGKLFSSGVIDSQTLDLKLAEIKAILEQTHQLFQHYFNGIEKRPPIEKARLLESRIAELQRIQTSTPTSKFKISQFILHYHTFRDLWDRKKRDKERV